MIDFFFGKPRSGKSYRAMDLIYNEYISDPKKIPKYRNILTNIGGFKFDKVNNIFLTNGSPSVSYRLVWKEFYKHLKKMYDMAMDDKNDDELNKYADYHKINDCLIVLDEASLYMKKYDDAISWWLAYHGHFRIRIIIIAQGPKQINPEYMTHTEIYYEAQPQSKQLKDNSLRYVHYDDIPFNKTNKFSSNTIKTSQDVYALYKSGEVDKPKKIIYKFIAMAIGAILAIILISQIFVSKIKNDVGITEQEEQSIKQEDVRNKSQINTSGEIITFRCDDKSCWLIGDKYKYKSISLSYLKYVLFSNEIELLFYEVKNEIFKLKNFKRGSVKVTLASMTDYSYLISKSVKDTYFKDMFQLTVQENKKPTTLNNPFTTLNEKKNDDE